MSCSSGPNSTVISLVCSSKGAPNLLGRSIFHQKKKIEGKSASAPAASTVISWLRARKKEALRSDMTEARRMRVIPKVDALIADVEAGRVKIDGATFHAWKHLAAKLDAPPEEGQLPPIVAHRIRSDFLEPLLPESNPEDVTQVRQLFARYITYHAGPDGLTTWQEAWNAFTGATPNNPGTVKYRPHRCADCGGVGYLPKDHLREDGRAIGSSLLSNYCENCRGTGKPRTNLVVQAKWVPLPSAQHDLDGE